MSVLKQYIEKSSCVFQNYLLTIDEEELWRVANYIRESIANGNRLHFTGIGKPAHIATYAASLFSSVGTPAYYLHGTEAVHGSSGQLVEGDIVICISNSGETEELKQTVRAIKNNGASVIAVTGKRESWLAGESRFCLFGAVSQEGDTLNRAPRSSVLVQIHLLQCLSVILQEAVGLTPTEYVRRHPGGALGNLRENEVG